MMTVTNYLTNLERDTPLGAAPSGWYLIRSVAYDGVATIITDTGARRSTAGDYGGEPGFARVSNIPRRGPAWPRLIFRGHAWGARSPEARAMLAQWVSELPEGDRVAVEHVIKMMEDQEAALAAFMRATSPGAWGGS